MHEAQAKCNSLHEDCQRLTQELQARDGQIADAMAKCHMIASANAAALHELAGSVQLVQAQAVSCKVTLPTPVQGKYAGGADGFGEGAAGGIAPG